MHKFHHQRDGNEPYFNSYTVMKFHNPRKIRTYNVWMYPNSQWLWEVKWIRSNNRPRVSSLECASMNFNELELTTTSCIEWMNCIHVFLWKPRPFLWTISDKGLKLVSWGGMNSINLYSDKVYYILRKMPLGTLQWSPTECSEISAENREHKWSWIRFNQPCKTYKEINVTQGKLIANRGF